MLKFIRNLVEYRRNQRSKADVKTIHCSLESHEQLFINKVIELLKSNSCNFSALWYNGISLDESVRSKDGKILIMRNGQIAYPITPELSPLQINEIKQLITPIFEKDKLLIINKSLNDSKDEKKEA